MGDEIKAMGAIQSAMEDLEPDEAKRVLVWAVDKYSSGEVSVGAPDQGQNAGNNGAGTGTGTQRFERIADLMDATSPSSIVDYVLVASYWFQVIRDNEDFTSQEVNSELKDLGHPSSNITDSYTTLMQRKPPAVRQVGKGGTTKQARKRYRLTAEGIKAVERMLRSENGE